MELVLFIVLGGLIALALVWVVRHKLSFVAQRPEDYAQGDAILRRQPCLSFVP